MNKHYAVTLTFTDGQHSVNVMARNEVRAESLAIQDARMGNPGQTFSGKFISAEVKEVASAE